MNRNNSNSPAYKPQDKAGSGGFAGEMFTHLRVSIVATIVLGVIVSGIYPAIVWGLAQALFHHQANGSLIKKDGMPTDNDSEAVGSALLGQPFSDVKYFHPRPSAAGNGYDPTASGGTNLGPLSDKLINGLTNPATTQPTTQPEALAFDGIRLRTIHYASDNGISFKLYSVRADGTGPKVEVPIKQFEDAQGNLNDVALVDAFPHPPSDAPDRMVVVADDFSTAIPPDAVTASSSGLDPHISVANAQLQAKRVADARKISVDKVKALVDQCTDEPGLGILGDPGVNVLTLNVALDNQK
ncbi:MAG: potassium-transporting ATPase subunit C [Tepidisphaeraceae bacterium]|jgi:K+-transporting ATPase ATPase C chain